MAKTTTHSPSPNKDRLAGLRAAGAAKKVRIVKAAKPNQQPTGGPKAASRKQPAARKKSAATRQPAAAKRSAAGPRTAPARQTPSAHEQARLRVAQLAEQARMITALRRRGWTYTQLGQYLDVRDDTVSRWHHKETVAHGLPRRKLIHLVQKQVKPPARKMVKGHSGPITNDERRDRDRRAKGYGLLEPEKRARRIRKFAKDCGLSLPELARLLHVGHKVIHKYADPNYKRAIAPAVLDAIIEMMETHAAGAELGADGTMREVLQRIYGRRFYTGFKPASPERIRVLDLLENYIGIDRRALYIYVPPPGGFGDRKFKPNRIVLKKFESLAELVEPGKTILTSSQVPEPKWTRVSGRRAPSKQSARVA